MKKDRLRQAILILNESQSAAREESHISDIDPRALLAVTLGYEVLMLSVPVENLGMLIWYAVYPIITSPLAHVQFGRILRQSLTILPLLVLIGIFNPIYDTRTAFEIFSISVSMGWITFISLILRGLMSLQALLLLVKVCGFIPMCDAMRRMGLPRVLATQLAMLYRYMGVLLQEAQTMSDARAARGYGRRSYGMRMWGQFVGQLLLRSIERAHRIYTAMQARGFGVDGILIIAKKTRWTTPDTVYCLVWFVIFITLRYVNISEFFNL